MFTIPIFILACLCFVNLALLIYVFYYSYATRHYDNLVRESKKLENDIKSKDGYLFNLSQQVDYYKNRIDELNRDYYSKKNRLEDLNREYYSKKNIIEENLKK